MDPRTMAALRAVVKDLEAQTERRTAYKTSFAPGECRESYRLWHNHLSGCASCGNGQRCDKGKDLWSAFQEEIKDGW